MGWPFAGQMVSLKKKAGSCGREFVHRTQWSQQVELNEVHVIVSGKGEIRVRADNKTTNEKSEKKPCFSDSHVKNRDK